METGIGVRGSVTTASATALHHHMISSGLAASMLVALRNDQVSGYGLIWRMYRGCILGGVWADDVHCPGQSWLA